MILLTRPTLVRFSELAARLAALSHTRFTILKGISANMPKSQICRSLNVVCTSPGGRGLRSKSKHMQTMFGGQTSIDVH